MLPLKEELGRATNSEQIRRKRSEQCIKNVAEGLRDMPQLDAATASALTSQVGNTCVRNNHTILVAS